MGENSYYVNSVSVGRDLVGGELVVNPIYFGGPQLPTNPVNEDDDDDDNDDSIDDGDIDDDEEDDNRRETVFESLRGSEAETFDVETRISVAQRKISEAERKISEAETRISALNHNIETLSRRVVLLEEAGGRMSEKIFRLKCVVFFFGLSAFALTAGLTVYAALRFTGYW